MKTLLDVKNLNITFEFNEQTVEAVRGSSLLQLIKVNVWQLLEKVDLENL